MSWSNAACIESARADGGKTTIIEGLMRVWKDHQRLINWDTGEISEHQLNFDQIDI